MTEREIIKILCVCIGVLGVALIMLDHSNDALRKENNELRKRLGDRLNK